MKIRKVIVVPFILMALSVAIQSKPSHAGGCNQNCSSGCMKNIGVLGTPTEECYGSLTSSYTHSKQLPNGTWQAELVCVDCDGTAGQMQGGKCVGQYMYVDVDTYTISCPDQFDTSTSTCKETVPQFAKGQYGPC